MLPEELVEVAYAALTLATNCAMALAEHGLLTEQNTKATAGELRRLAGLLEHLHDQGQDALPSAQSARLNSAANALENLRKFHRGSDGA